MSLFVRRSLGLVFATLAAVAVLAWMGGVAMLPTVIARRSLEPEDLLGLGLALVATVPFPLFWSLLAWRCAIAVPGQASRWAVSIAGVWLAVVGLGLLGLGLGEQSIDAPAYRLLGALGLASVLVGAAIERAPAPVRAG